MKPFLLSLLLIATATAQIQQPIYMKVGGGSVIDGNGVTWAADTCTGDLKFNNPGSYPSPIYNSTGYTAAVGTPFLCSFQTLTGLYRVTFHLIEAVTSFNAPQKRTFDIFLNGKPIATNVDIYALAGGVRTPYDLIITVQSDGPMNFSFISRKSSAMIAAIEIIPLMQFVHIDGASGLTCINPSGAVAQCGVDTAVIQSRSNVTSGSATQNCVSTTGDHVNYTATCSFTLPKLEPRQVLNWFVDVTNVGPVTLNVDTLGVMPVLDRRGNPLAPGMLAPGLNQIWNDGGNWRLVGN